MTVLAGASATGKSTFGLRYLINAPLAVRFLYDPFPGEFNPALGEFAHRLGLEPAHDLYQLSKAICTGWVAYSPYQMFPDQMVSATGRLIEPEQAGLDFFLEFAWLMSSRIPGQKVIVIDEVHEFCSRHFIPRFLARIARRGSHVGLRLMVNAHEAHKIPSSIMDGCSEMICFKLAGDSLATAVEQGFNASEVENLQRLQWVARNMDSGGELRGRLEL